MFDLGPGTDVDLIFIRKVAKMEMRSEKLTTGMLKSKDDETPRQRRPLKKERDMMNGFNSMLGKMASAVAIFAGAALVSSVGHAEARELPAKDVVVDINDVFVPGGFSSDADAYVVVNGLFPNGCYRWKGADVQHDGTVHKIKPIATVTQGLCIRVLVPFTKEVKLGRLEAGKHTLRFVDSAGNYLEKEMEIED